MSMLSYRARPCPKCQYYVGYSVAKPFEGTPEAAVESFCLNCNYRLPVRAVIRGMKRNPLRQTSGKTPRAGQRVNDFRGSARLPTAAVSASEGPALGPNYPRELRAIGQELERRGFKTFNLKCSGDAYFVWSTETMAPNGGSDSTKNGSPDVAKSSDGKPTDPAMKMLLDRIVGFQFTAVQIQRLEQEGRQNRRYTSAVSDRGSLAHLLRTVGEQVYRCNQRLLAIAWGERNISVVTKTAGGWLDMDVMRLDNLYDLWVRMYLQRSH
jgi:hypothetical protein